MPPERGPMRAGTICFRASSRAQVDGSHAQGLGCGGVCDGPPGLRGHYHAGYYAAFLLDPDGNRLEAVYHGAQSSVPGLEIRFDSKPRRRWTATQNRTVANWKRLGLPFSRATPDTMYRVERFTTDLLMQARRGQGAGALRPA